MIHKPKREDAQRVYPSCCTSAFCGRINCDGCRSLPTLAEFKRWKAATNATCDDPIWCPSIYTAKEQRTERQEG